MTYTTLSNGKIYKVLASEIEYIGYYYGANGGNEDLKKAYTRIGNSYGRKPDFLINCELFDFNTRKPASDVVDEGKIHRLTECFGMAFVDHKKPVFSYRNNVNAPDYVGFYPQLIRNGKRDNFRVPAGLGGSRGRTALATDKAGNLYLALVPNNGTGATLQQVADGLIRAGATDGGNLDGGGSSQWYSPGGCTYTGRKLRGFVAVWCKQQASAPTTTSGVQIIKDYIPAGRLNRPGKSNPMKYITIHETGNTSKGAGAKAHASYLRNVGDKVSWHYTVDDSVIYQHLPDNETAYHAGDGANGPGNAQSIGIEICVNVDGNFDKAVRNAAWLVRKLMAEHNISAANIKQHHDWNGKDCPHNLRKGGWADFMALCKSGSNTTPSAPKPIATKTVQVKSALNIRQGAPTAFGINMSRIVGTYRNGERVNVYEAKAGWWRTDRGWCYGLYLK